MATPSKPSDSLEQREAERLILRGLADELGIALEPRRLQLGGATVAVDGVSSDESAVVEVFAHQGPLKGGQVHKVAKDALKLITWARSHPHARLILAFADGEAAACVTGASWLAEAIRLWDIDVRVVELDGDVRAGLRTAQARQIMVNPA